MSQTPSSQSTQEGQISTLPGVTTYITGHDARNGKSLVQSTRPGAWSSLDGDLMAFNVIYTTSEFPVSLNNDADIEAHDKLIASKTLGLVNPRGTVCRVVDFAPGYKCIMHRTQSLDYGIVLEGEIEMILDSDQVQLMRRGDIAVQRATMHAWRNSSETNWARMIFVLQECQDVVHQGTVLGEDLGAGVTGLPSSQKGS